MGEGLEGVTMSMERMLEIHVSIVTTEAIRARVHSIRRRTLTRNQHTHRVGVHSIINQARLCTCCAVMTRCTCTLVDVVRAVEATPSCCTLAGRDGRGAQGGPGGRGPWPETNEVL